MGLNVACFVFSDEVQIILKYLRLVGGLHNDLMHIWNALVHHPIIEVLNLL